MLLRDARGSRVPMDAYDVELRDRLKRTAGQIEMQHRRLEPLFEDLSSALASGISRDAQTAAFRLDGAIRAHFLLEEKIIFPAIRGLCSQNHTELEAFAKDHRQSGCWSFKPSSTRSSKAQLDLAAQSLESCRLAIKDHEGARRGLFAAALTLPPSERTL